MQRREWRTKDQRSSSLVSHPTGSFSRGVAPRARLLERVQTDTTTLVATFLHLIVEYFRYYLSYSTQYTCCFVFRIAPTSDIQRLQPTYDDPLVPCVSIHLADLLKRLFLRRRRRHTAPMWRKMQWSPATMVYLELDMDSATGI